MSVEVVTILLLLLALNLLPQKPPRLGSNALRLRDPALGAAGGLGTGLAAWPVMTTAPNDPRSSYHWAPRYSGSGGHNDVNETLVDFPPFDIFGSNHALGETARSYSR